LNEWKPAAWYERSAVKVDEGGDICVEQFGGLRMKMCSLEATRISIPISICAREHSLSLHVVFLLVYKETRISKKSRARNKGQCSGVGPAPCNFPKVTHNQETGRCDLACFANTPCSEVWPSSSHESLIMGSCTPPQDPGLGLCIACKILLCVTLRDS
jgi:hypothetical protein